MSPGVKLVTRVTRGLGLGLRFGLGLGYQVTKGSTRLPGYSGSALVPTLPVWGAEGIVCLTDSWKRKNWDKNEKERDEKENIKERYREEERKSERSTKM